MRTTIDTLAAMTRKTQLIGNDEAQLTVKLFCSIDRRLVNTPPCSTANFFRAR